MSQDIPIPPDVVEAVARALCIADQNDPDDIQEGHMLDGSAAYPLWAEYQDEATAALRAGLRAMGAKVSGARLVVYLPDDGKSEVTE